MKTTIVKLGFCLLFLFTAYSAFAANPKPTVTRIGSSPQRSATGEVSFTVKFDVAVTDFDDLTDVSLTATAGASVTSITPVSTTEYTVLVGGLTITGNVKITVPANVTNSNDASTGEETIDFDGNPAPVITHPDTPSPTTGSREIKFTVDFGEVIDGTTLSESDFSFTGTDATFGALTIDAGSLTATTPNQVYTFTITIAGTPTVNKHIIVSLPANKVKDTYGNDNNASSGGSNDITWAGALPTVVLTKDAVPQTVNAGSLDIYGTVVDGGGLSVTGYGTIWSYSSTLVPGNENDHENEEGTGIAAFHTVRDANLDSHKLIYYKVYAENSLGRAYSEERTIWTLDDYPTADGKINSATATSGSTIDITFDAKGTTADGLVIIKTLGNTAVASTAILQGKKPSDQPGYVDVITSNSQTSYTVTGLAGATQYTFVVIPYNVYNAQDETTNYRNAGYNSKTKTTQAASSKIVQNAAPANTLAYATKPTKTIAAAADGLVLADLTLVDGNGPANDADDDDTELATLKISVTNFGMIGHVGLLVGGIIIDEGTLDASGMKTFTIDPNEIKALDDVDAGKPFQIIGNFTTAVTDGAFIKVKIEAATVTATSSGLVNSTAGSFETPAGKNLIAVNATKFVITGLPATINPNQNFGFTASLVDDNDVADTNIGGNVTLSLNAADGTMTPASPSVAVTASGDVTFTNLQLSDAGDDRRVTLHATGSPAPSDQVLLIDVISLGVKVIRFDKDICVNSATPNDATDGSTFTDVGPIVIQEQDKSDFSVGTNQTLNLMLPANFIFYVGASVIPTKTGSDVTVSATPATYLGNNIIRIKYDVTGTTSKDVITIDHMMVKYIGTDTVQNRAIIRVGGTAIQKKNSEDDGVIHGRLSALGKITGSPDIDFKNTNAVDVQDNQVRFSKTTNTTITFQGFLTSNSSNINGVFAGDGVLKGVDGLYRFTPSTVTVGTHPISFTYTDPVGGCKTIITKIYEIYASSIDGLATKYCDNADIVHLTGPANPPLIECLPGVKLYEFDYYVYLDPDMGWLPLAGSTAVGTNDFFNPAAYLDVYNRNEIYGNGYGMYIGYWVSSHNSVLSLACDGGQGVWASDFIFMEKKPQPTILNTWKYICSSDAAFVLKSRPNATINSSFDRFWISEVGIPGDPDNPLDGVTGNSGTGFSFDPSLAMNGATGSKDVQLNFRYMATNGCSATDVMVFTDYEKPAVPSATAIKIDGVQIDLADKFCETTKVSPITGDDPTDAINYNWFDSSNKNITANSDKFTVMTDLDANNDGRPEVGTKQFSVTQTTNMHGKDFAGCESDHLNFTIQIIQAPKITFTNNVVQVCNGQDITLGDLEAEIVVGSGQPSLGGTWSSSTSGVFKTNGGTAEYSLQLSRKYTPTQGDKDAKQAFITLTSAVPADGVCSATANSFAVGVNGSLSLTPPTPVTICGTGPDVPFATTVTLTATVENNNTGLADPNAAVNWVSNGLGTILNQRGQTIQYIPTQAELDGGALISFTLATDDPDQGGPCSADTDNSSIKINKRAQIEAGDPFSKCSDEIVPLNGQILAASPPGVTATWAGGTGNIVDVLQTATQVNSTYTAGSGEQTAQTTIAFTLTTNDPDGPDPITQPCPAVSDVLFVTLFPKPAVPEIADVVKLDSVPNYKYCVNDDLSDLVAIGQDISWFIDAGLQTIRGTNSKFPPAAGGASSSAPNNYSFWVTQTTNKVASLPNGCRSDGREVQLTINPLPVPGFSAANFCLDDDTQFTDGSVAPSGRTIVSWSWNFDDLFTPIQGGQDVPVPSTTHGGATGGTFNNPTHRFATTGQYDVSLTVTSSDNCSATASTKTLTIPFDKKEIKIGDKPQASFTFLKVCDGDETAFTYNGTIPGQIVSYDWDFGDATPNGTGETTDHEFSGVGEYDVTLTATTDLGCFDVITTKTHILPYINTFPYIENFESNNHGWFAEGKVTDNGVVTDKTSWGLMTSAGTIFTDPTLNAGSTFWATHTVTGDGDKTYFDNERSVLYGPCVDMTFLDRPVIAMDYATDLEPRGDGAYIEYKEEDDDGNGAWVRLGDNTSGLDWYNESSIGGLSSLSGIGQDVSQLGWSKNDTTDNVAWTTGRYNLDKRSGATKLRFRIVFGSNVSTVNTDTYNGFAIDYFKLESRNRLVLVENFTSASSATTVTGNTTAFQAFPADVASNEVVKIEYHTGLPAQAGDQQDPIFTQNPMDPNARASFYGLSAVPRGYIDGYSNLDGSGMFGNATGVISTWAANYYSTESLKTSPIEIDIKKPKFENGTMNLRVKVIATEAKLPANQYSLYIAVVEKSVGTDAYVLRKMIPSASGIKLNEIPEGDSLMFDQTWTVDRASLSSAAAPELIVIAFVQSDIMNSNKERPILQAAFNDQLDPADIDYTTGLEVPFLEQTALYPNPADKIAYIELPESTKSGVQVNVIDQVGRPVIKSEIGVGQKSVSINTTDLSPAMYIIQLRENGVLTTRKLVVTHAAR